MFSGAANVLWISISILLTHVQSRCFEWNSIEYLCLETKELYVDMSAIASSYLNSSFSYFKKWSPSSIVLFSIVVVIVLPFTTIISNYATFYLFIHFVLFLLSLYLLCLSRLLLNLLIELCTYLWETISNYWTRLSKISWFVSGEQINYSPKPKAEANNWSVKHWQITIFCDNRVQ